MPVINNCGILHNNCIPHGEFFQKDSKYDINCENIGYTHESMI